MKNLAIIIPVYNEEKFLPDFLKKIQVAIEKLQNRPKLIFVNDGSLDSTGNILRHQIKSSSDIIVDLKKNSGKGNAMRVGAEKAISNGAEYLIYMDGDGQHDPQHLPEFIAELRQFPIVFGFRKLKNSAPFIRKIGNNISSFIIKHVFRINRVGDVLCGYFGIRADIYQMIKWTSNDYGVEAEISAIVSKKRVPFKEILVNTIYLDRNKGVNIFHALLILSRIPMWTIRRHIDKFIKIFTFITLAFILALLAYKNPYSTTSLIPNIEPYPDTLYYSVPAWNFVNNKNFVMESFGYQSKIVTPPLYSIYLIPFFIFFRDIRSFYYANMLLVFGSLYFFLLTLNKVFYKKPVDELIIGLIGFFFVSNFYVYTQPSLLMTESSTLFLVTYALYALSFPISKLSAVFAGFVGLSLIMIKFSNLPVAIVFTLFYLYKILKEKNKFWIMFLTPVIMSLLIFVYYIFATKILIGHKNLSTNAGFSFKFFVSNFQGYLKILLGDSDRYLWFGYPLMSRLIAISSVLGIALSLFPNKLRYLSMQLLLIMLGIIGFMSFFYYRDIRYIGMAYPISLFFVCLLLFFIKEKVGNQFGLALIFIFAIAYLFLPNYSQIPNETSLVTYKKQIGLNFRHSEVPWNYLAVINFNSFFTSPKQNKPYLGTFLPPYFIDIYDNGNYNYLPISSTQEFIDNQQIQEKYKELINSGNEVYISPYYQNNKSSWRKDYENIVKEFNVSLVKEGCLGACSIYRLSNNPKTPI